MLRTLLIALVLSLTSCASREIEDSEKANLHLKIGTGYLTNGQYPQALDELLSAEKLDPDNSVVQNNLGIAFFVREKYSEARDHFQKAIAIEPKYTESRNNLGRTLIELGLIDEAITQLDIAVNDLTYQFPEKSNSNLGIAYFKNNNFSKAHQFLKTALQFRSGHCLTANYYARSLYELKKYKEASLAFDQASNLCKDEKLDEPVYYGGITFFKLNQFEEARARLTEVLTDYPNGQYAGQAKNLLDLMEKK